MCDAKAVPEAERSFSKLPDGADHAVMATTLPIGGRTSETQQIRLVGDTVACWEYCQQFAAERSDDPSDGYFTLLLSYRGEDDAVLTVREIASFVRTSLARVTRQRRTCCPTRCLNSWPRELGHARRPPRAERRRCRGDPALRPADRGVAARRCSGSRRGESRYQPELASCCCSAPRTATSSEFKPASALTSDALTQASISRSASNAISVRAQRSRALKHARRSKLLPSNCQDCGCATDPNPRRAQRCVQAAAIAACNLEYRVMRPTTSRIFSEVG